MLNIINEKSGYAVVEIDEKYYVVSIDRNRGQVYSVLPSDNPESGTWFARMTESGVKYVASGRSYKAAMSAFYRLLVR
jgi:hypothetical protein